MCESFPGDKNGSAVVWCADNEHVFVCVAYCGVASQHPFSQNTLKILKVNCPKKKFSIAIDIMPYRIQIIEIQAILKHTKGYLSSTVI